MPGRSPERLWVPALASLLGGPAAAFIVFDPTASSERASNLVQTLHRWDQQLGAMGRQLQTAREAYALAHSAYTGLKNWRDLGWVDGLALFELPFFDGVAGIEDVRDLAAGTALGLERLQAIYQEASIIQRMMDDPLYRENQAFAARVRLMHKLHSRQLKRRILFTREYSEGQLEQKRLDNQLRLIQDQLQVLSAREPAPLAAIAALQNKVAIIQARIQARAAIQAQRRRVTQEQEQVELKQAQSDQEVARLEGAKAYWQAMGQFWTHFK